jgi:toxin ParE1/3/4
MVKLSSLARADMREIWNYLDGYGRAAANNFIREITHKFDLLGANPKMGRRHDEYVVNLRSFPYKKYLIFYFEIADGEVEIYRVVHGSRDIETLFDDFISNLEYEN